MNCSVARVMSTAASVVTMRTLSFCLIMLRTRCSGREDDAPPGCALWLLFLLSSDDGTGSSLWNSSIASQSPDIADHKLILANVAKTAQGDKDHDFWRLST